MDIYKKLDLGKVLSENAYAGRGIVIGKTEDGKRAAIAYFIMGRSVNSRNRIFVENGEEVVIHPYDPALVKDPSLIIYSPIRCTANHLVVTNGDQTDTICDFLQNGMTFAQALETRCFEPDAPNFTPRISGMLTFDENDFTYQMSILKSVDAEGSACCRYNFNYPATAGLGHFLHTYACDGNPIPTFQGEPERVEIGNDIDAFTDMIWNNLNEDNKISLYVRFVDLASGEIENRMINKHLL